MKKWKNLIFLLSITFLSSCSNDGELLQSVNYGKDWPLIHDECYVKCIGNFAVIVVVDGETYAVNEAAEKLNKYKDIEPITKDNPNYPGEQEKMSLSDIEFAGLQLCE